MNAYFGAAMRRDVYGIRVDRATAVTPATTHTAYFTISGGRIILTALVGEVTVAGDGTASSLKWASYPTTGSSGDLCAATAITSKEIGTLLGITGLVTDAMLVANAFYTPIMYRQQVIPIGALHLDASGSNGTASIKWSLFYIPLDDGASVAAA